MTSAVFGLVGVAIGAAATLLTNHLRERAQDRRERARIASQTAIEEFKLHFDYFRADQRSTQTLPPLAAYVAFHLDLLDAAGDGGISARRLEELRDKHEAIDAVWFSDRGAASPSKSGTDQM